MYIYMNNVNLENIRRMWHNLEHISHKSYLHVMIIIANGNEMVCFYN